MARFRFAIVVVAVAVAALLLFIALDSSEIYAPGAGHLARFLYDNLGALRGFETPIGFVTIDEILRKIYALIAFAVVGFCCAPLFRKRERLGGAALAVTQFSTVIEIFQKLGGSRESLNSNVFDILSGTIGGVVGAWVCGLAFDLAARVRRPKPPALKRNG